MRTLDHWETRFAAVPVNIECPKMQLCGFSDHESPVFAGPGYIEIKSLRSIEFTMFASSSNNDEAFRRLVRSKSNPYEVLEQFRLEATDYQGIEWGCGWTSPQLKGFPKLGWLLTGKLSSLVTQAIGQHVSRDSSVELVYQPTIVVPMAKAMLSVTTIDDIEIERKSSAGQHTVRALDTAIEFAYRPTDDRLRVTAKTSDRFQHPYAENLPSEPFTVLLGQLIYPRLVARNFGNGTAQVWLRASPRRLSNTGIAALFDRPSWKSTDRFWELYTALLTLFAEAKGKDGHPNFDRHPLTRFYEEIIQASQGSRWVQCLTFASAGEGLAKMLMRPEERQSEIPSSEIESLRNIVAAWKGDDRLRGMILSDISRRGERTIGKYLRDLEHRGLLEPRNCDAWSAVRNEVMHGNLVSPWGTQEEDQRLTDLADLVHRLSRELIAKRSQ